MCSTRTVLYQSLACKNGCSPFLSAKVIRRSLLISLLAKSILEFSLEESTCHEMVIEQLYEMFIFCTFSLVLYMNFMLTLKI